MLKPLLIILGVLLALLLLVILLVFFGRVRLRIVWKNRLDAVFYLLGIPIPLFRDGEPSKMERQLVKSQKKGKEKQKRVMAGRPQPNLLENLQMVLHILQLVCRELRGKLRIRVNRFAIRVASDDAAKTALLYGATVGVTTSLWQLIQDHIAPVERSDNAMTVTPDYLSTVSSVDVDIVLRMRVIKALLLYFAVMNGIDDERAAAYKKAAKRTKKREAKKAASPSARAV